MTRRRIFDEIAQNLMPEIFFIRKQKLIQFWFV